MESDLLLITELGRWAARARLVAAYPMSVPHRTYRIRRMLSCVSTGHCYRTLRSTVVGRYLHRTNTAQALPLLPPIWYHHTLRQYRYVHGISRYRTWPHAYFDSNRYRFERSDSQMMMMMTAPGSGIAYVSTGHVVAGA
eukprot:977054-Rhodomonas_salina.2